MKAGEAKDFRQLLANSGLEIDYLLEVPLVPKSKVFKVVLFVSLSHARKALLAEILMRSPVA